jgi:exodeoxyribonuclease VII large subunit
MSRSEPSTPRHYTLSQLTGLERSVLDEAFREQLWLVAEVSEVREAGRHCYLEFVEKRARDGGFAARASAHIWSNRWNFIQPMFERATGQRLAAGMKVLACVQPEFHEVYGFALNVLDLDPSYTLGEQARLRLEILRALQEAGIATLNKDLPLPRLTRRIAVISAAGAAGYQDFCRQLDDNVYGLAFRHRLFEAVMQGEKTEPTIIAALDRIADELDQWDAVCIIRGGGATSDLAGFDTLALAEHVAQFPLPVITGIGHERDDTVLDLISHHRVKTPTAAAEFFIAHQKAELDTVDELAARLVGSISTQLLRERQRIDRITAALPRLALLLTSRQSAAIGQLALRLRHAALRTLALEQQRLGLMEQTVKASDPRRLLRLGFSITRADGRAVTSPEQLRPGQRLETTLAGGVVTSEVLPS